MAKLKNIIYFIKYINKSFSFYPWIMHHNPHLIVIPSKTNHLGYHLEVYYFYVG